MTYRKLCRVTKVTVAYNPGRQVLAPREPVRGEHEPMKRTIRMLILMVGVVGACSALAAPLLPSDGGPIPMCNPKNPKCTKT